MKRAFRLIGVIGLTFIITFLYELKFMRSHITIGTCLRMERSEAQVYDSPVIRKVIGVYADHYETHSYVNGTWDTEIDYSSTVSFHAIPYMEVVTCP